MSKAPTIGSQSLTVIPRNPVHLGQAIPRLDGGSAFRTSFLRPTERSPSLTFWPPL